MAENTFNLRNRIKTSRAVSNIDYWYGPYQNTEEACQIIPLQRRNKGLTVGILDGTFGIMEYWWTKGIEDKDLVLKENKINPTLQYVENFPAGKKYQVNENSSYNIEFVFKTTTPGQCTYKIYKNDVLFRTFKGSSNRQQFSVDTEKSGTFIYKVEAEDFLGIGADNFLEYNVVIGGITLKTNVEQALLGETPVNPDTTVNINSEISIADSSKHIYLEYILNNETIRSQQYESNNINDSFDIGSYLILGYNTLKIVASSTDKEYNTEYSWNFLVLTKDDFQVTIKPITGDLDTNNAVDFIYKIVSGSSNNLFRVQFDIINAEGTTIYSNESDRYGNREYKTSYKFNQAGSYSIKITAIKGQNSKNETLNLNISAYVPNYIAIQEKLISEFNATGKSNTSTEDRGVWNSEQGNYKFVLNNINYDTNGWVEDEEVGTALYFSGDSYGILKNSNNNNANPLDVLKNDFNTGFTCELLFKAENIGILESKALSIFNDYNETGAGISVSYNNLKINSNTQSLNAEIPENEWTHVVFVIDKNYNSNPQLLEDYNKYNTVSIYINGSLCAINKINDQETFYNSGQTLLNTVVNGDYTNFGECYFKLIRFYEKPLKASEIVNNYIASVYNQDIQNQISNKNKEGLPIVHFIRMTEDSSENNPYIKNLPEGHTLVKFSDLSKMTEKQYQKKQYVRGKMLYQKEGVINKEFPYVVIQTQGTSSLLYPVKNYKVIIYEDNMDNPYNKKYKVKMDDNWEAENAYTLKCDYMDASHLNNTPSATYYDHIIDTLYYNKKIFTDSSKLSPAKQVALTAEEEGKKYYDAIKGFPCIVYCYETEQDYNNNMGTYMGSYMFNLDKSAKSLGFEASDKCQSFEGTSNKDGLSAGTFCSYSKWKDSIYEDYLQEAYNLHIKENPEYTNSIQEFKNDFLGRQYSSEGISNKDIIDGGILLEKDLVLNGNGISSGYDIYGNEYDYTASDFEARYDYRDRESGERDFWGANVDDVNPQGLLRMLTWVSKHSEYAGTQNDSFKQDFETYFSKEYTLLYLIQTIFWGMIDNLGKNAMWDTWDGLKWFPRPYDMDSMAGKTNTGKEEILPNAEISLQYSPESNRDLVQDEQYNNTNRFYSYNTRNSLLWNSVLKSFKIELQDYYKVLREQGLYDIDNIMSFYKNCTTDIIGETYYNRDMVMKFIKYYEDTTYFDRISGNRLSKFKSWLQKRIIFCDTYFNYKEQNSLNTSISFRADAIGKHNLIIQTYSPSYVTISVGSGKDQIITGLCSEDSYFTDLQTSQNQIGRCFNLDIQGGDKEVSISSAGNIKNIIGLGNLNVNSLDIGKAFKLTSLQLPSSRNLKELSLENNTFLQSLNCNGCVNLGVNNTSALDCSNSPHLKTIDISNTKITGVYISQGGALKSFIAKNADIRILDFQSLELLEDLQIENNNNITRVTITNCNNLKYLNLSRLPVETVVIEDCSNLTEIDISETANLKTLKVENCKNVKILNLRECTSKFIETLDLQLIESLEELDLSYTVFKKLLLSNNIKNLKSLNLEQAEIESLQYVQEEYDNDPVIDFKYLKDVNVNIKKCYNIKNIINFNKAITGSYFTDNSNLLTIKCSEEIGMTAYGDCSNLFRNCTKLSSIEGPKNFSECARLSYAFYKCPNLPYLQIRSILETCKDNCNLSYSCYQKGSNENIDTKNLPDYFLGNVSNSASLTLMFYNSGLESFNSNAFSLKNKTSTTTDISRMLEFTNIQNCANVLNYFPEATNISGLFSSTKIKNISSNLLQANRKITNIKGLFYGCKDLITDISSYKDFFKNNSLIENASLLFYNTQITGMLPNQFLTHFTSEKAINVQGMFADTKLIGIEDNCQLSNNGCKLKIGAMFYKAFIYGNTVNIPETLFKNCIIEQVNFDEKNLNGATINLGGVFEGCKGINRIHSNMFDGFTNVKSISKFFKDCSNLTTIETESDDALKRLFQPLENVTNLSEVFKNCTSLNLILIHDILPNKQNLLNVSGLFYGIQNIINFDPQLLQQCSKLQNASQTFKECINLNQSFAQTIENILDGCSNLKDTSEMFYNTKLNYIEEGDEDFTINIPVDLFKDCRNTIENVSRMFYKCSHIKGIIEDSDDYGLFSNCIKLQNVQGIFENCMSIKGKLPKNMFKSEEDLQVTDVSYMFKNVLFTEIHQIENTDTGEIFNHLIHPDYFKSIPKLTTIEGFLQIDSTVRQHPDLQQYIIDENIFDTQTRLQNISYFCKYNSKLTGNLSNIFKKSLNSIIYAQQAFLSTGITSMDQNFMLSDNYNNTVLTNVKAMFYKCNSLNSDIAEVWNNRKFIKIGKDSSYFEGYCYGVNVTNSSFTSLSQEKQDIYKKDLNL